MNSEENKQPHDSSNAVTDVAGSKGEDKTGKSPKRHLIGCPWLRIPLKIIMWIVLVVALIPVLLYVPPIQLLLKDVACKIVSDKTGMGIRVDKFRLRFPLDVALEGVSIIENTGDTLVQAKALVADVKIVPLFHLDVKLNKLKLEDGYYRMVSPDSSMVMKIKAGLLEADGKSSFDIADMNLNLNRAKLQDGDISLYMDVWKKKIEPRDTTAKPFVVRANDLTLRNVRYSMSMLPTIDTLSLVADNLTLRNGLVDLGTNDISAEFMGIDGGNFIYLAPTKEYQDTHPAPVDTINPPSPPTTIKARKISVKNFGAVYGIAGVKPLPGFDANYIQVEGVNIELNDFYNQGATLTLPIASIHATERCGLQVTSGNGVVSVDPTGIKLTGLNITTPYSEIHTTADIPYALMEMKPNAPMSVVADASVAMTDIVSFMPSVRTLVKGVPMNTVIGLDVDASGSLQSLDIPKLNLSLPEILNLRATGYADNALDFKKLRGALTLDGELSNPGLVQQLAGIDMVNIPKFKIKGNAKADHQTYVANIDLRTSDGDLAGKGDVSLTAETYDVDLVIDNLDAGGILPGFGLGSVTASLTAKGAGFNPSNPDMATDVDLHVGDFEYSGHNYNDITLKGSLHNGDIVFNLDSGDPIADLHINGNGRIDGEQYTFDVDGKVGHINLKALGITPNENQGHVNFRAVGTATPSQWLYDANLHVDNFYWMLGENEYSLPDAVDIDVLARNASTDCSIRASGTEIDFKSTNGLQDVVNKFMQASNELTIQLDQKQLAIDVLQPMLPPFDLDVNANGRGLLNTFLAPSNMGLDTLNVCMTNDSILRGRIGVQSLHTGSLLLDTITLGLDQRGKLLDYKAHMGNRPGVLDEFADVTAAGYIGGNRASMYVTQHNIQGQMGYRLGLTAAMQDSTVSVHFTPLKATIAYMPWVFNTDNHIDYTFGSGTIDANLRAQSNESSILLQTEPMSDGDIKLNMNLDNIHVEDFLALSVMAPPVRATVNSDLSVVYRGTKIEGDGKLSVANLVYDGQALGNFNFIFDAGLDFKGNTEANLSMLINEQKALTAHGILYNTPEESQSTAEFGLTLNQFPLDVANPFLGSNTAQLQGALNGDMKMTGSLTKPKLNGYISFADAQAFIPIAAATLKLDNERVNVKDNVVKFDSFEILGANDNPLVISGDVDVSNISDIYFNLTANANDMLLINTPERSRSDITGKLFMNLNATAKGPLSRFDVDANLNVLGKTNVTYTLASGSSEIQQLQQGDVVRFVQFADTTQVAKADSVASVMAMRINASVNIATGTQVTVNLNPGGSNKVYLNPSGTLNYTQSYMGDTRLNGQLFTGEGYARYNVPVLGEKKFVLNPQSFVTFNGDIMNPTLSIKATDQVRANVQSSGGNSRTVNFDVSLNVTNTLSSPNVLFDLSTNDDLTVQNELQSMSADQRSNQAMNLLLYGQYVGPGSKSSSSFSGNNALYGFLESQINSWAANNIKGVDLSFGIAENQQTEGGETSTSTSYSYQVSKSLFDNKFKIVVGGNYTTNTSVDENFAQNLISDISFEYMIKQTNTTSIFAKLFRHTGFESILEGNVTETGVGVVMRRRLSNLKNLFRFRRGRKGNTVPIVSVDSVSNAAASMVNEPIVSADGTERREQQ